MGKLIASVKHSETLLMSECTDGFWLWDKTRQMNVAVKSKTPTHAFIEALTYYQSRLTRVEKDHSELSARVDAFVSQFQENDHGN